MNRVLVIAEAGSNHNGSLEKAKQLAKVAKECGADIVKYQIFSTKKLFKDGFADWLSKYEFDPKWLKELVKYCDELGIEFMATPFDEQSADIIDPYVKRFKIGSYELTHIPLLKHIAKKGKPVILSVGMAKEDEIVEAFYTLENNGCLDISFMYCVSNYPTDLKNMNINLIKKIGYDGLSDHTESLVTGALAVSYGAKFIEKHFTLDRNNEGPDHKYAMNPEMLKTYIQNIRDTEIMLFASSENSDVDERKYRRSIYAKKNIDAMTMITEFEEKVVRPEGGLHPREFGNIRYAVRPIMNNEPITDENSIPVAFCLVSNKGNGHISRCQNLCRIKKWYADIHTDINMLSDDHKIVILDVDYKISEQMVKKIRLLNRKIILIHNNATDKSLFDEYYETKDCLNPLLDRPLRKYKNKTILLSMGALDEDSLTNNFINLLRDYPAKINIVLGNQFKSSKFDLNKNMSIMPCLSNDDMTVEIRKSHVGIVLYGVTAWEFMKAKTPTICISSKKNSDMAKRIKDKNYKYIGTKLPTKKKLWSLLDEILQL